ncbi:hypothetical protein [Actinomycetospora sp. TBRC 11914]|nr:hypothetical protein [Actinomycetospora sp. TBRC 11914]NMO90886.1 hypothetical protein [Actinomycetospora sp. TBRC 11914]
MDDRDDAMAPFEADLASERALRALVIKLSWQPMRPDTGDLPEQIERDE